MAAWQAIKTAMGEPFSVALAKAQEAALVSIIGGIWILPGFIVLARFLRKRYPYPTKAG